MTIDTAGNGTLRASQTADPRTALARDKFFTLRPKPLERWLWRRRIPAGAERVFWFHWAEGSRSGDWCSQFSLQYVARHCEIDTSTVTRAYQLLKSLGVLRRTDPGRDPANPFEQATAVTEVLLPPSLLAELAASPNRPGPRPGPIEVLRQDGPLKASEPSPPVPLDPLSVLSLQERRERLKVMAQQLSPGEQDRWNKALCGAVRGMTFDAETHVSSDVQAALQSYLAARPVPTAEIAPSPTSVTPRTASAPRRLSVFEVARLRRGLQKAVDLGSVDELSRQVLWSIEDGALRGFTPTHGINIALKKIREGQWSRPNRMPPNWMRKIAGGAPPETCSRA